MMLRSVVLASILAGCATELDVEDQSVFFPTLRGSKRVGEVWLIDAVASYAAGSDTASGTTGKPIVVGGVSFPGAVDVDFDLTTVRIEGRARHETPEGWLFEGFFGVALYDVDVTVKSGGARAHDDRFEAGPLVGGRAGWRPAPRFQIYTETYIVYPLPDGIVPSGEVEIGFEFKAAGPVSVLGGWRFQGLELLNTGSDYDFQWSGPFLGVGFDF